MINAIKPKNFKLFHKHFFVRKLRKIAALFIARTRRRLGAVLYFVNWLARLVETETGQFLIFATHTLKEGGARPVGKRFFEPKNRIDEVVGKCELVNVTNQAAYILRENTGTSGIVESARAAVSVLAEHDIPHLIVGGLAVQEHGYPRVTIDVDIVVPDVLEAVEFLTASLTGPFYRVPEVDDRVEDRRNGVQIDLLPAGKVLKRGCKVPFPQPTTVAEQFQIISLEDLIALKLDSWAEQSRPPAQRQNRCH